MRKEFKFGIGGLIFGFVFCLCLFFLVVSVLAAEPVEMQEFHESETVHDDQVGIGQTFGQEIQAGQGETVQSTGQDEEPEPVQEEQIDLTTKIPADQLEMLDNWARELDVAENEPQIEPFASGVIVGELADLLQENVIENDGYTEESWQRYELAVAAGWDAISNFMIYTNDEVRAVIDELQAAITGLEYPAGNPPITIDPTLDSDYMTVLLMTLGMIIGAVWGLSFVAKFHMGV